MATGFELAHRQKFKHALLDLIQPEVVVIKHAARLGHINVVGLRRFPGQLHQPVQVGAHHRIFGRAVRHALQPFEFFVGLLGHLFGHLGLINQFVQFSQLGGVVGLVFAQLFLDGP